MGYTMRVDQYCFTEWVRFNHTQQFPIGMISGQLNCTTTTQPTVFFDDENENLAYKPELQSLVIELCKILHAGWRAALSSKDQK